MMMQYIVADIYKKTEKERQKTILFHVIKLKVVKFAKIFYINFLRSIFLYK